MTQIDPLALEATVQAWADITIKEWITKVRALGIHDGALLSSFVNHVFWSAGGDLRRVEFAFLYYGKFVDMGVGNGVNKDTRDALISAGFTRRRPKPWFTSTFYNEVAVLRHKLSERLAQNTQLAIIHGLQGGIAADL